MSSATTTTTAVKIASSEYDGWLQMRATEGYVLPSTYGIGYAWLNGESLRQDVISTFTKYTTGIDWTAIADEEQGTQWCSVRLYAREALDEDGRPKASSLTRKGDPREFGIVLTDVAAILRSVGIVDRLHDFRKHLHGLTMKALLKEFAAYATANEFVERRTFTTEFVSTAAMSDEKFMAYRQCIAYRKHKCETAPQRRVVDQIANGELVCARGCDLVFFE